MKTAGRPPNIYGATPKAFDEFWKAASKYPKAPLEPSFGAVAYAFDERGQHLFRLMLIPADPQSSFYWVRLTVPDGSFEFAFPAVVAAADLPKLLEYWEVNDDKTLWTEGAMVSPSFPKGWRMCKEFFSAKGAFFAMVKRVDQPAPTLETRAGIHTLTNETVRCAGLVAGPGDIGAFAALPKTLTRLKLEQPLLPEQVDALRALSATYFREKLLSIGRGRLLPYVPHAHLLGIPSIGVTELAL